MWLILFDIAGYLGYFFFMIIFMVGALIFADSWVAWLLYAIGASWQLLALLGGSPSTTHWIVYLLLLALNAFFVVKLKNVKESKSEYEGKDGARKNGLSTNVENNRTTNNWHCSCGRDNASYVSTCTCGKNKRDIEKNC